MDKLIADSGSTKTDWRLVKSTGETHSIQTDGLNPYYQTTAQMVTTLRAQLLPELKTSAVTKAFFYGTGCTGPPVNNTVADALRTVLPDLQEVDVNSDMLGAARATMGHQPGIACILGTGSNACCYDGEQITRGIQSLGFWLGDEGSGGYLGKTLVRDFFQQRLPVHLQDAFQDRYKLDRLALLDHAYKKPFPNRYFASFTPFLTDYLSHPYIATLVTDAFVAFLEIYVKRFPESQTWPIHFVGSIAHHFAQPLRQATQQTSLTIGTILKAPVERLVQFHQSPA